jgi:hypothetical protein
MINNFEDFTEELTPDELKLVNPLMEGLRTKTKENTIKAPVIVKKMNEYALKHNLTKITEPRLRKLVNFIRVNGKLPIIATSQGYYVSYDKQEILDQINSLTQRANSIMNSANGLKNFL